MAILQQWNWANCMFFAEVDILPNFLLTSKILMTHRTEIDKNNPQFLAKGK